MLDNAKYEATQPPPILENMLSPVLHLPHLLMLYLPRLHLRTGDCQKRILLPRLHLKLPPQRPSYCSHLREEVVRLPLQPQVPLQILKQWFDMCWQNRNLIQEIIRMPEMPFESKPLWRMHTSMLGRSSWMGHQEAERFFRLSHSGEGEPYSPGPRRHWRSKGFLMLSWIIKKKRS